MPFSDPLKLAVALALSAVLAWASYSDIKSRLIPNRAVILVFALFLAWIAVGRGATFVSALEAAAIAFVVTFILYLVNVLGAGDSKLFAALALFAGLAYLPLFAFATALAGGCIAAISLASRPRRALTMFSLKGKGDYGRGVPYGVAISIGAMVTIWGQLTHLTLPYAWAGQV